MLRNLYRHLLGVVVESTHNTVAVRFAVPGVVLDTVFLIESRSVDEVRIEFANRRVAVEDLLDLVTFEHLLICEANAGGVAISLQLEQKAAV